MEIRTEARAGKEQWHAPNDGSLQRRQNPGCSARRKFRPAYSRASTRRSRATAVLCHHSGRRGDTDLSGSRQHRRRDSRSVENGEGFSSPASRSDRDDQPCKSEQADTVSHGYVLSGTRRPSGHTRTPTPPTASMAALRFGFADRLGPRAVLPRWKGQR